MVQAWSKFDRLPSSRSDIPSAGANKMGMRGWITDEKGRETLTLDSDEEEAAPTPAARPTSSRLPPRPLPPHVPTPQGPPTPTRTPEPPPPTPSLPTIEASSSRLPAPNPPAHVAAPLPPRSVRAQSTTRRDNGKGKAKAVNQDEIEALNHDGSERSVYADSDMTDDENDNATRSGEQSSANSEKVTAPAPKRRRVKGKRKAQSPSPFTKRKRFEKSLGFGLVLPHDEEFGHNVSDTEDAAQRWREQQQQLPAWERSFTGGSFPGEFMSSLTQRFISHRKAEARSPSPSDTTWFKRMMDDAITTELPFSPPIRVCPPADGSAPYSPPFEFVYTNRIIYPGGISPQLDATGGCSCKGPCPESLECACRKRQEASCKKFEAEAKGFAYDSYGRVKNVEAIFPILECNSQCGCPSSCSNRTVGRGNKVPLDLFHTASSRGWGIRVRPAVDGGVKVLRGTILGVYAGELLVPSETSRRETNEYEGSSRNYLFDLDYFFVKDTLKEFGHPQLDDWSVDAFKFGNFTRFFNHCCSPNLAVRGVYIDDRLITRPLHVFMAIKDIDAGEECLISYYEEEAPEKNTNQSLKAYQALAGRRRDKAKPTDKCYCGIELCRGVMFQKAEAT